MKIFHETIFSKKGKHETEMKIHSPYLLMPYAALEFLIISSNIYLCPLDKWVIKIQTIWRWQYGYNALQVPWLDHGIRGWMAYCRLRYILTRKINNHLSCQSHSCIMQLNDLNAQEYSQDWVLFNRASIPHQTKLFLQWIQCISLWQLVHVKTHQSSYTLVCLLVTCWVLLLNNTTFCKQKQINVHIHV